MNIPTGLYYRARCIRTIKKVWDKQSTKDYIIDSCKRSTPNRRKPIVVINETTKKAECYIINASLTDFEEYHDKLLCREIEIIANYSITKYKIQKSNKSKEDKEKYVKLAVQKYYNHKELEPKDEKDFNKFVKEL